MKLNSFYESNHKLIRKNTFMNEIIMIDGQGRSGKNLVSVLLSTMKRIEKMRLDSQFDYIPRYYFLGKMTLDAAITALRTEADEKYYYNAISRDVNFRISDYSGVLRQGKRFIYLKRLFMPGDENAVIRLQRCKPIFQEMTHDGLHVAPLYFEAFGDRLKFIHIFRDPIENVYEQNKRNFGTRIGSDPRELQLTHSWNGIEIPVIAIGREEEYVNGNSVEKLVLMVDIMFRRNLQGFHDLKSNFQNRVLFVEFEDFVVSPDKYISVFENFIGEKFGFSKKRIMKREKIPRKLDPQLRIERKYQIQAKLGTHYTNILEKLILDYDKKPWTGLGFVNDEEY